VAKKKAQLFVPLGQIRENDASHRVNCFATLRGHFLQISLNGSGAALHNPISFTDLSAKTTNADTTRAKSTQAQKREKGEMLPTLNKFRSGQNKGLHPGHGC
jgi:hypothetical protein